MTKEEWIKVRSQEEFPLSLFFEYYLEKGGLVKNINEFEKLFNQFALGGLINGKHISYETYIHRMINYYDEKFELCINYETIN